MTKHFNGVCVHLLKAIQMVHHGETSNFVKANTVLEKLFRCDIVFHKLIFILALKTVKTFAHFFFL